MSAPASSTGARRLSPRAVDVLLALAVVAEGALEFLPRSAPAEDRLLAVAFTVPIAAGVLVRRTRPLAAAALALCALLAFSSLDKAVVDSAGGPWLVTLFLIFNMGLRMEGRRLLAGAVMAVAAGVVASSIDQFDDDWTSIIFIVVLMAGAPIATGQMLRNRAALNSALRAKAAAAEAERLVAAEAAAADERARVASELHDVVAHALGAMTVQASAARRLVDRDPELARQAFRAVEDSGREALTELRRLLGVLRREDDEIALSPQPRLAALPDLARRTRAAGLPVDLSVEGTPPDDLSAGIDLTAFRLVQEALEAARDLGRAGRADVAVRYHDDEVQVDIADDGGIEPERPLLGMSERVRVYGGELRSGPRDGGGHRVRARLPVRTGA